MASKKLRQPRTRLQKNYYLFFISSLIFILLRMGVAEPALAQNFTGNFSFSGTSYVSGYANFRQPLRPQDGNGIQVGPLALHPFLGIAEILTDNAFRSKKNRESAFVQLVAPGIQAQLPFRGRHRLMLDYRATQQIQPRFSENNALAQDAIGRLTLNLSGDLTIDLQGGHAEGFDPRGSTEDSQAIDINTWNTNNFIGDVSLLGNVAGFRLTGTVTEWNFENNNQNVTRDRLDSGINLTFFGALTPNADALLDIGFSTSTYTQNKQIDTFTYTVAPGLRWDITGRTKGEVEVGWQVLNFDRAPVTQPAGSSLSDGGDGKQSLFMRGAFTWDPTSRLNFRASPFRTLNPGGVSNASSVTFTGVNLQAVQNIGTRTSLSGTFSFVDANFSNDPEGRRESNFGAGLGLQYRAVKWLGFRLNYAFNARDSNVNRFNFYSNTVMLSIQGIL